MAGPPIVDDPLERLVGALRRLPGIGGKTAERLAFFILRQEDEYAKELAAALVDVKARIHECASCCNLTADATCSICRDTRRDTSALCVVAAVPDLHAVEKSGFRGVYHVLHGLLAPLEGVGPADLRIDRLLVRVGEGGVREVIVATNPTVEGETTALYLHRLLAPLGVRVTRIASGVPIGSDLQFADHATLARALEGRRDMGGK
jgi:recombination protein RecR